MRAHCVQIADTNGWFAVGINAVAAESRLFSRRWVENTGIEGGNIGQIQEGCFKTWCKNARCGTTDKATNTSRFLAIDGIFWRNCDVHESCSVKNLAVPYLFAKVQSAVLEIIFHKTHKFFEISFMNLAGFARPTN